MLASNNPSPRFFRVAIILAIILITTQLVFILAATNNLFWKTILNDALSTLAAGLATLGLFYAAQRSAMLGHRTRAGWRFLAYAFLAYTLGNLSQLVMDQSLPMPPTPSIADLFYLLTYALLIGGIVLLTERSHTPGKQLELALDTSVIMLATGLLYWVFVLAPIMASHQDADWGISFIALVYPVLDLALIFVLLRLAFGKLSLDFQVPLFFLLATGACQIATDIAVSIEIITGNYQSGSPLDTGYLIVCIMVGLASAAQVTLTNRKQKPPTRAKPLAPDQSVWTLFVPYIWVIAAYSLVIWNTAHPLPITPPLLAMFVISLVILTLARQAITLLDNRRLYTAMQTEIVEREHAKHALRQANAELEVRVATRTTELQTELAERQRAQDRQRILYNVLHAISGQLQTNALAHAAAQAIVYVTHYPHVCLALPDESGARWIIQGASGKLAAEQGTAYPIHQGIIGRAFHTGQMQWVRDTAAEPNYICAISTPAMRSEIVAPIRHGEYLLGALNIESERVDAFDDHDALMIQSLADVIALALENARLYRAAEREIAERTRIEETLRDSEEKYRQLFEVESDAILLIDNTSGEILDANASAVALYGYSRAELQTMRNLDLSAQPDATRQAMDEKHTRIPIRYHRKKDGTIIPVEITASHLSWQSRHVHIAAIRDITERQRAQEKLRVSEAQWRALVADAPAIITTLDRAGIILSINRSISSKPIEQIIGTSIYEYLSPTEQTRTREVIELIFRFGQPTHYESAMIGANRKTIWLSNHAAPLKLGNQVNTVIFLSIDITERKQMEEQLRHLSTHDALTQLYNRAFFEEELNRLRDSRQFPVTLVVADVDDMKTTNDTQGHVAGDQLLRRAAAILSATFRAEDVIARIGGDEFAILMPETDALAATEALTRCREALARQNATTASATGLRLSLGAATAASGTELDYAFTQADAQMYRDKATHKAGDDHHTDPRSTTG